MKTYTTVEVITMIINDDLRSEAMDKFSDLAVAGPAGTMKDWMVKHSGSAVNTIQAGTARPWFVTDRKVFTNASTYATFGAPDGSRRYYKGCKVVSSTDDALIVMDGEGQVIFYYVTD